MAGQSVGIHSHSAKTKCHISCVNQWGANTVPHFDFPPIGSILDCTIFCPSVMIHRYCFPAYLKVSNLMKPRFLLPILGVCILLIAACAPPPVLRSDDYLSDTSIVTGETCEAPCWRGITPGETPLARCRYYY